MDRGGRGLDLTFLVPWLKLVHILSAFLFVAAHGVSMFVAFQLRNETDRSRLSAKLEVSQNAIGLMYAGLLFLLLSGIGAGIISGWFTSGRLWIWVALVLLVLIAGSMYPLATQPLAGLRWSIGGGKAFRDLTDKLGPSPATDEVLQERLSAWNPVPPALIGVVGLAIIVWLMVLKPF